MLFNKVKSEITTGKVLCVLTFIRSSCQSLKDSHTSTEKKTAISAVFSTNLQDARETILYQRTKENENI